MLSLRRSIRSRTKRIVPLAIGKTLCTTVYKVQEAFSSMTLPEGNVYQYAIEKALYE